MLEGNESYVATVTGVSQSGYFEKVEISTVRNTVSGTISDGTSESDGGVGAADTVSVSLIACDASGTPLTESKIAEGEKSYYKVVATAPDGTIVTEGTVDVTFADKEALNTTDYTATNLTNVAFGSIIDVAQALDDVLKDGGETFTVTLSNAQSTVYEHVTIGTATVTTTIVDETPADSAYTFKLFKSDASGNIVTTNSEINEEGETTTYYVVKAVDTSGNPLATQPSGNIDVAFSNNNPTSDSDYTKSGTTVTVGTAFSATAVDDALADNNETFTVSLTGNYTQASLYETVTYDTATVTTTIKDAMNTADTSDNDNAYTLKLFAIKADGTYTDAISIDEAGGSGKYVVLAVDSSGAALTTQPGGTLSVNVADGSAIKGSDYSASASLTATVGTEFTLSAMNDVLADNNETFSLSIGSDWSRASEFEKVTYQGTVTTTIVENGLSESDTVYVRLITNDADAEGQTLTHTVQLVDKDGHAVEVPTGGSVTVSIAYTPGANLTSGDYTPHTSITLNAGESSATVSVATTDDVYFEATENYTATIASISQTGGKFEQIAIDELYKTVTGTITSDDAVATLSINDVIVDEDAGTMSFTVTASHATEENITFDYATSNDSATAGKDYNSQSGNVTMVAGQTTATITVPIHEDFIREGDETFVVTLSSTSSNIDVALSDLIGIGTIQDISSTTDITPEAQTAADTVFVRLVTNDTQAEGVTLTHTVQLVDKDGTLVTVPVGESMTVTLGYTNGAGLTSTDYTAQTSVTINGGDNSAAISNATLDDYFKEGNESYTATITGVTNTTNTYFETVAIHATQKSVTGTIIDGSGNETINEVDTVYVKLSGVAETMEAAGATLTHTISLVDKDGNLVVLPSGKSMTVNLAYTNTDGVDGIEAADLTTKVTSLTISGNGSSSYDFSNVVAEDFLIESTEGYTVSITSVNSAYFENIIPDTTPANITTTGTILDDASSIETVYAIIDDNQTTVEGGTITHTIKLVNAVGDDVTLPADASVKVFFTIANSTTENGDFDSPPQNFVTIGSSGSATVSIETNTDGYAEASEKFSITLSDVENTNNVLESLKLGNADGKLLNIDAMDTITDNTATDPLLDKTIYEDGRSEDESEVTEGSPLWLEIPPLSGMIEAGSTQGTPVVSSVSGIPSGATLYVNGNAVAVSGGAYTIANANDTLHIMPKGDDDSDFTLNFNFTVTETDGATKSFSVAQKVIVSGVADDTTLAGTKNNVTMEEESGTGTNWESISQIVKYTSNISTTEVTFGDSDGSEARLVRIDGFASDAVFNSGNSGSIFNTNGTPNNTYVRIITNADNSKSLIVAMDRIDDLSNNDIKVRFPSYSGSSDLTITSVAIEKEWYDGLANTTAKTNWFNPTQSGINWTSGSETDADGTANNDRSGFEVSEPKTITLSVNSSAGDISISTPKATVEDTATYLFKDASGNSTLTITDTSTVGTNDSITGIKILTSTLNGATISGGGVSINGDYTVLDPSDISNYQITPASHSSADLQLTLVVTTKDGTSAEVETTKTDYTVVVTPAAEVYDKDNNNTYNDTDNKGNDDILTQGDHTYTGSEDTWVTLHTDGAFKLGISNEDSDETMSVQLVGAPVGSYFSIDNGSTFMRVSDANVGVTIDAKDMDKLTFKAPAQFSGDISINTFIIATDTDHDTGTKVVTKSTEYDTLTLHVDAIADTATISVEQASTREDTTVALKIKVASDDAVSVGGSETFNVTISDLPNGSKIEWTDHNNTLHTYNVDATGTVTLVDFRNETVNFTSPLNSNADYTDTPLKITAETHDGTVVSTNNPQVDLKVSVAGVADAVVYNLSNIGFEENTIEETTFALNTLFDTPVNIDTTTGEDTDGSERVTVVVTGLDAGFDLTNATFLGGGEGESRKWTMTLDEFKATTVGSVVGVSVPNNYSGELNFTVKFVTTENDGNSLTQEVPVSVVITPTAEAQINLSTSSNEDTLTKMNFNIDYQDGDTNESVAFVWIDKADVSDQFTLYLGSTAIENVSTIDSETIDGKEYYKLTGEQANNLDVQFDADVGSVTKTLDIKYQTSDSVTIDGNVVTDLSALTSATYTITNHAVTDKISVVDDQETVTVTSTNTTVALKLTIKGLGDTVSDTTLDDDGSESIKYLLVTGVPQGVSVEGGTYIGDTSTSSDTGMWKVDIVDIPLTQTNEATAKPTLNFKVEGSNATYTTSSATISVTAYNQDGTASMTSGTTSFNLEKAAVFDDTGSTIGTPATISKFEITDIDAKEDVSFTLDQAIDAELSSSGNFSVLIQGLENCTVSGAFAVTLGDGSQAYVVSGTGTDVESVLSTVTVTPNANYNSQDGGTLHVNATLTTYAAGGEKVVETVAINEAVTPQTDSMNVSATQLNGSALEHMNEDGSYSFKLNLSTVDDSSKDTGLGYSVVNGSIKLTHSGVDGTLSWDGGSVTLDSSSYTATIPLSEVDNITFAPATDVAGTATFTYSIIHTEDGAATSHTTTGSFNIIVDPIADGLEGLRAGDVIVVSGSGDEDTKVEILAGDKHLSELVITDTSNVEKLQAMSLSGVPNGFTVYYSADASASTMAENAGKDGTTTDINGNSEDNNTWNIPITGGDAPNVFVQAPEDWSGELTGLKVTTIVNDGGSIQEVTKDVSVTFVAVADKVTLDATNSFGDEGQAVDLNLNAMMDDLDGSETMSVRLSGIPEGATFTAGSSIIGVSFDGSSYTITNINASDINSIKMTTPEGVQGTLNVTVEAAWTTDGSDTRDLTDEEKDFKVTLDSRASGTEDASASLDLSSFGVTSVAVGTKIITAEGVTIGLKIATDGLIDKTGAEDLLIEISGLGSQAKIVDALGHDVGEMVGGKWIINLGNPKDDGENYLDKLKGLKIVTDDAGANDTITVTPLSVDIASGETIAGASATIAIDIQTGTMLTGTEGNDIIIGSTGDDIINAGGGNDTIVSGDGKDTITAGDGDDTIYAGAGNDTINAGAGNDKIIALDGNDTIDLGTGVDTVDAGAGNDTIKTDGNDKIVAGAGDDTIATTAATIDSNVSDTFSASIDGGEGSDTLDILSSGNFALDLDRISNLEVVDLGTGTTNNPNVNLTLNDLLSDGATGNETITIHGDNADNVSVVDTNSTTVTETTGTPTDSFSVVLDGSNSAVIDTILVDNAINESII